eukprot:CAMPEP_0202427686 /NCGR_PEP_ID=MMETSP1345-20130828/1848_1 /ASSEMBLY_ACC=CAM_ASM_000843 /TAXON_ID=342563 /ORGANISM="Fabrea Fabrea salina" /LENGTH=146 /DNA_ID=CAMNT_0049038461 /DNA_START=827 /DNA_END=1268 /DNA_ORIENTATION=+
MIFYSNQETQEPPSITRQLFSIMKSPNEFLVKVSDSYYKSVVPENNVNPPVEPVFTRVQLAQNTAQDTTERVLSEVDPLPSQENKPSASFVAKRFPTLFLWSVDTARFALTVLSSNTELPKNATFAEKLFQEYWKSAKGLGKSSTQ